MKTIYLIAICLTFSAFKASAQSATFNPDSSVTYLKSNFKKGQEVQLSYGSKSDKNFAFVQLVRFDLNGDQPKMVATYSKQKFIIDYVFLKDGKCTIRGLAPWSGEGKNYVVVDVEGAIDNKELVAPENVVATVKTVPAPTKKAVVKKY